MKWWIIALMLVSQCAFAGEPLEMYVTIPSISYNENGEEVITPHGVELVVTDQPCEKWPTARTGLDLHYAYALERKTGDKVEGCYAHDQQYIYIELVNEATKEMFQYKINADNFVRREHVNYREER